MANIVLDTSKYFARTHRFPPKKGAVRANFTSGGQTINVDGASFAEAVNTAKTFVPAGVHTLVLEDILKG